MSDEHFDYDDEKPKRHVDNFTEKPKRDSAATDERKHGGCLTAFLVVYLIAGVWSLPVYFFLIGGDVASMEPFQSAGLTTTRLWINLFVALAGMVCAVGLWRWKRWGYRGLLVLFGASIFLSAFSGKLIVVISGVTPRLIMLGVLIWVVQPVQHHLE